MRRSCRPLVLLACVLFLQIGCTTLQGDELGVFDPYEKTNRSLYAVQEAADTVVKPIARGYKYIVPKPVHVGVRNVFNNLRSPTSVVNGFLQGRPKAGGIELGRFLLNSTLGLGGLFDVGTRAGLPAQNEDFGQTFASWGWTRSRYLYVPFIGPTTVRDLPDVAVNIALPRLILGDVYNIYTTVVDVVSLRADVLDQTDARDASALDPYSFTREAFYEQRRFEYYNGAPPAEDFFDELDELDELDEPEDAANRAIEGDREVGASTR